jgi:hypothetical protein
VSIQNVGEDDQSFLAAGEATAEHFGDDVRCEFVGFAALGGVALREFEEGLPSGGAGGDGGTELV